MADSFSHLCTDTTTGQQRQGFCWKTLYRGAVVGLLYFVFLIYPALRIATACLPNWEPSALGLISLFSLPLLGRMFYRYRSGRLSRWVMRLTMLWLGTSFIALCVLLPSELLALILPISTQAWGIGVLGVVLSLTGYASWNAQQLTVSQIELSAKNHCISLRICQLSDIHLGSRGIGYLRRIVAQVNACQPDVIMITGDLIDVRDLSYEELGPLGKLKAPIFFCTGNHERYVDLERIDERLRSLGVHVLRNTGETFKDMYIVGIDDAESPQQVAHILPTIAPASPDKYTVLLYHRPHGLEDAAQAGVDLMLSGHTHNGQIVPFDWLVRRFFPRIQGRYDMGTTTLYVSPGTGTWGPIMRLGSRNEITILDLNRGD